MPDQLTAVYAENVVAARKALGLTQVELAAECDVTQQNISGIERGDHSPSDALKVRLARALKRDAIELFPLEGAS